MVLFLLICKVLGIELRTSVTLDSEINVSPPNYSPNPQKYLLVLQVSRTALVRPGICLIAKPGQEPALLSASQVMA